MLIVIVVPIHDAYHIQIFDVEGVGEGRIARDCRDGGVRTPRAAFKTFGGDHTGGYLRRALSVLDFLGLGAIRSVCPGAVDHNVGHGMLGRRLRLRARDGEAQRDGKRLIRAVVVGDRQRLAIVVRRKVAFRMDGEVDALARGQRIGQRNRLGARVHSRRLKGRQAAKRADCDARRRVVADRDGLGGNGGVALLYRAEAQADGVCLYLTRRLRGLDDELAVLGHDEHHVKVLVLVRKLARVQAHRVGPRLRALGDGGAIVVHVRLGVLHRRGQRALQRDREARDALLGVVEGLGLLLAADLHDELVGHDAQLAVVDRDRTERIAVRQRDLEVLRLEAHVVVAGIGLCDARRARVGALERDRDAAHVAVVAVLGGEAKAADALLRAVVVLAGRLARDGDVDGLAHRRGLNGDRRAFHPEAALIAAEGQNIVLRVNGPVVGGIADDPVPRQERIFRFGIGPDHAAAHGDAVLAGIRRLAGAAFPRNQGDIRRGKGHVAAVHDEIAAVFYVDGAVARCCRECAALDMHIGSFGIDRFIVGCDCDA